MIRERPKLGERWRVVVEGTITRVPGTLVVMRMDDGYAFEASTDRGAWERLPDPEPEYPARSVWIDAEGIVYERSTDFPLGETPGWWTFGYPSARPFDVPVRPLTRLVPEVKP